MADNVTLPPGGGGATIRTEDVGGGLQMPLTKIHNGAVDVDGGPITPVNPFDVALSDGTARTGVAGNPLRVDPTGVTTQPVSAAALPLPAGAATDAAIAALVAAVVARLGQLGQALMGGSTPVAIASDQSPVPVSGTVTAVPSGTTTVTGGVAATQSGTWLVELTDGSNVLGTATHPIRTDPTGATTQPVSATSLPLPAGAAADATVTARLGTLGQKAMAGSTPVAIASDQSALAVTAATLPLPAGAATDATLTGGSAKVQVTNFPSTENVTAAQGAAAAPSGAWPVEVTDGTSVLGTPSHPVRTDPTGATTQPVSVVGAVAVSGAVTVVDSVPLAVTGAVGAAQVGTWQVEVTDGTSVLGTLSHPVRTDPTGATTQPVSGAVNVSNFPATQPVSGTVNVGNLPATQPVSAAALPLPAGAAQDATLSARLGTLGQKTSAGSTPVVIASDQSAVAVSGTVTTTPSGTQTVAGTVTAAQGAAAALAGAWPVEITDGANVLGTSAHPIAMSAASLPLPAGAAQDATLTGGSAKTQVVDGSGNTLGTSTHPVKVDPTGTTTQPVSGSVSVSNFPGTQPVSGSVSVSNLPATQPISATSLPLPTGAAQDATLTGGTAKVQVTDGAGHQQPAGDAIARSVAVQINDGANLIGSAAHPVKTDPTGTTAQPVSYPARTYVKALEVNSALLKATTGNLCSLKIRNRETNLVYAMLFDQSSATPPGNGAVPVDMFVIPESSERIIGTDFFTESGGPFTNGILVVLSSTDATLTITTVAANHNISGMVQ